MNIFPKLYNINNEFNCGLYTLLFALHIDLLITKPFSVTNAGTSY